MRAPARTYINIGPLFGPFLAPFLALASMFPSPALRLSPPPRPLPTIRCDEDDPSEERNEIISILEELRVFKVTPTKATLRPGEALTLTLSYTHAHLKYAGLHRVRCASPTTSVPLSALVLPALSLSPCLPSQSSITPSRSRLPFSLPISLSPLSLSVSLLLRIAQGKQFYIDLVGRTLPNPNPLQVPSEPFSCPSQDHICRPLFGSRPCPGLHLQAPVRALSSPLSEPCPGPLSCACVTLPPPPTPHPSRGAWC